MLSPLPLSLRRVLTICAFFTTLATTTGCGFLDTCDVNASRCNGNTLEECVAGNDTQFGPHWSDTSCPVACQALATGAACVDSPQPVDACAHVPAGQPACWDGNVTSCTDGYPLGTQTCSGDADVCVVANGLGLCAESSAPDPVCAGLSGGGSGTTSVPQACDGQDQVTCAYGYVIARMTCASPSACVVANGQAFCAESSTPSPLCSGLAEGGDPDEWPQVCDGQDQVQCQYGFVVARTPCAAPSACVAPAGLAFCAESTTPNPACASLPGGGDGVGTSQTCDGHDQIQCESGFVISRTSCASPTPTCVALSVDGSDTTTICASGSTPDPRCGSDGNGFFCANNTAYACTDGYVVSATDCTPYGSNACLAASDGAGCQ